MPVRGLPVIYNPQIFNRHGAQLWLWTFFYYRLIILAFRTESRVIRAKGMFPQTKISPFLLPPPPHPPNLIKASVINLCKVRFPISLVNYSKCKYLPFYGFTGAHRKAKFCARK
uniref:Uncharacterized protein n=1 Tax=Sphaerodactylus townsendi TaxID=933632 RepID=A0ACB8EUW2_9SAUR